MILQTGRCPDEYKVDEKTSKKILRFKEFDQVIGYRGKGKVECKWLLVIAKKNSWIQTAYPVVDKFVQ